MEYNVGLSTLGRMFMLPAEVVDEHLKELNEDQLKVLLCIYCLGKRKADGEELSKLTGITPDRVHNAIVQLSVLKIIETDVQTAEVPVAESSDIKLIGAEKAIKGTKRDLEAMSRVKYSPRELGEKVEADPELKQLCGNMEALFSKPLTHSNLGDIVEMYEHLELSPAVIMMIGEYCKGRGKTSSAYILKVAQEWFSEGITSFEAVESKIIAIGEYNSFENRIKRIIGLSTNTTKKQRECFERWQMYAFSDDMYTLAYDRTVENCQKFSLAYMDKILSRWFENGINTLKAALDDENKRKEEYKSKLKTSTDDINDAYEQYIKSLDFSAFGNKAEDD